MRLIAMLVAVCLLAGGCTAGRSGAGPSSASSSTPARTSPSAAPPATHSPAAAVLRITSPRSGDSVHLPATVRYELGTAPSGAIIRMYSGTALVGWHRDFALAGSPGSITLPNDKMLTGHRTLTFCLFAADQVIEGSCQTLSLRLAGRK
jgi:hypothetical protein